MSYLYKLIPPRPGFAARQLRTNDPAVSSGLATAEIYPMPSAVVRPHHKPTG